MAKSQHGMANDEVEESAHSALLRAGSLVEAFYFFLHFFIFPLDPPLGVGITIQMINVKY